MSNTHVTITTRRGTQTTHANHAIRTAREMCEQLIAEGELPTRIIATWTDPEGNPHEVYKHPQLGDYRHVYYEYIREEEDCFLAEAYEAENHHWPY